MGREESADTVISTRIVEAMRLGVVPVDDVRTYTVGRGAEREQVTADLEATRRDGGALRAFLGDYGTGKTHMLEVVRELALERDFLVANVVLDPEESAPSHPKRVYRRLVRSLTYPDAAEAEDRGLRTLFDRALRRPDVMSQFLADSAQKPLRGLLDRGAHLYLTPALRYWDRLHRVGEGEYSGRAFERTGGAEVEQARHLLVDWVEGQTSVPVGEVDDRLRRVAGNAGKIYCMMDYRPWARIYGYLVSGIAALARRVGYAGLVVLFDEAEFYSLMSPENQGFARTLFKAYARASSPPGEAGFDLPFDPEELELGGYGVQQDLPTRYDADAPLYTAFAMTPHEEGIEALQQAIPADRFADLEPLDQPEYAELAGRVVDHYRRAVGADDPLYDRIVEPLTKLIAGLLETGRLPNPRAAMKFVVEFLDIARHRPDDVRGVIGELREAFVS